MSGHGLDITWEENRIPAHTAIFEKLYTSR